MDEPTCETCKYWQESPRPPSHEITGTCRIYPPQVCAPRWPEVFAQDWCGEHSPRVPLPVVEEKPRAKQYKYGRTWYDKGTGPIELVVQERSGGLDWRDKPDDTLPMMDEVQVGRPIPPRGGSSTANQKVHPKWVEVSTNEWRLAGYAPEFRVHLNEYWYAEYLGVFSRHKTKEQAQAWCEQRIAAT